MKLNPISSGRDGKQSGRFLEERTYKEILLDRQSSKRGTDVSLVLTHYSGLL